MPDPEPHDVAAASPHLTAGDLRRAAPGQQAIGGYSRDEVDALFERAAATIDALSAEVRRLTTELEPFRANRAAYVAAEKDATDMLLAAQRAVDMVKAEGQREAEHLVADARAETARAQQLRHVAESAVEAARAEAAALIAAAEAERNVVVANATGEAAQANADLESENKRLQAAIDELRDVWSERVREALARLDRIATPPEGSGSGRG